MSRRHFFSIDTHGIQVFRKFVYLNEKKYGLLKSRLIKRTKIYNTLEFTAKTKQLQPILDSYKGKNSICSA